MARDPIARLYTKLRTMHRLVVQRQHPEIITLLSRWGYNSTSLQEYRYALQAQAGARPQTALSASSYP
jgi:hypothetical protein